MRPSKLAKILGAYLGERQENFTAVSLSEAEGRPVGMSSVLIPAQSWRSPETLPKTSGVSLCLFLRCSISRLSTRASSPRSLVTLKKNFSATDFWGLISILS